MVVDYYDKDYIELQCPFCAQEHWFNYKLEHFEDECPNVGLFGKEHKARAIQWIHRMIENSPTQK